MSATSRVKSPKSSGSKGAQHPNGAIKAAFPARVQLELATLVEAVPPGDEWLHEIKLDGYRLVANLRRGRARLVTRGEQDWTERFSPVAEAIETISVDSAIFDGEVVVLDEHGVSDFQLLQNALSGANVNPLQYFVFDLLYLDGYDLRQVPLLERKALLHTTLGPIAKSESAIHYCDHVIGRGATFYTRACALGLEGTIAKRAARPYLGGRTRDWLKIKCTHQQEFVIGGYTDPAGSRQDLGALLLGVYENGRFVYAGKVGTGFTQASLAQMRKRLEPIAQRTSPFDDVPRAEARGAHWVAPKLIAEVRFTSFTHEGRLRHPSFRGLREDKRPTQVIRETPVAR